MHNFSFDKFIKKIQEDADVQKQFMRRIREGKLTRDENPDTHLCVYFAGYDPSSKQIFIGHHKKSNLWLINGGHIDLGETPMQAVKREIWEEWGIIVDTKTIGQPFLLTITPIDNKPIQMCTAHYDIWFLIKLNKKSFHPNPEKLQKEFHDIEWQSIPEAKKRVVDPNTLKAILLLENLE